jgi:hypothetical protein
LHQNWEWFQVLVRVFAFMCMHVLSNNFVAPKFSKKSMWKPKFNCYSSGLQPG